jgi:hypothetical protein
MGLWGWMGLGAFLFFWAYEAGGAHFSHILPPALQPHSHGMHLSLFTIVASMHCSRFAMRYSR